MESNGERYIIYQDVKQLYIMLNVGLANYYTWYQLETKFVFCDLPCLCVNVL